MLRFRSITCRRSTTGMLGPPCTEASISCRQACLTLFVIMTSLRADPRRAQIPERFQRRPIHFPRWPLSSLLSARRSGAVIRPRTRTTDGRFPRGRNKKVATFIATGQSRGNTAIAVSRPCRASRSRPHSTIHCHKTLQHFYSAKVIYGRNVELIPNERAIQALGRHRLGV